MQLCGMDDFSFELLKSPLYLSGCAASLVTLGVIRWADLRAQQRGSVSCFDPIRQLHTRPWQVRVLVGGEPLLDRGQPFTSRLISPKFLFSNVVLVEPFSIVPPAVAWLCVLLREPILGAKIIAGAILWRVLADWLCMPVAWPGRHKVKTLALKITWLVVTGIFNASITVLALAAWLVVLIVIAFLLSGAGKARRPKQ